MHRPALFALALGLVAPSFAQAPTAPLEGAIDDLDPLDLARLAQRARGGAFIAAITDEEAKALTRVRAIRASPFLAMPEAALEGLARVAHGRDPLLAPIAALAAHRIAARLSLIDIEANETRATVEAARRTLALLRDDTTARPDLRRLASFAVDALEALLGTAPEGD